MAGRSQENHASHQVATIHPHHGWGCRSAGGRRSSRPRGRAHRRALQRCRRDPGCPGPRRPTRGSSRSATPRRSRPRTNWPPPLPWRSPIRTSGILTGRITDASTGDQLWARGADVPMQPASVTKVLTTAAALLGLDRDARLTTTVTASDRRPGLVVLKGGGDATLSAAPAGQDTWYQDAARISDLADQVSRSGTKVTAVAGRRQRVQRPDDGTGLGPPRHRRRRHRTDGSGDARRRPHPAGQRPVATVHDTRARCRSRAGRRAAYRPCPRQGAALGVRRRGDRVGAVAATDRAITRDDEQLRQRDGGVDRPGSRCRTREAAKFRRIRPCGYGRVELRQDRHGRLVPGGLQRVVHR